MLLATCNYRFAHGRSGIEVLPGEKRELGVMLDASSNETKRTSGRTLL
jgi:hypothetical protein